MKVGILTLPLKANYGGILQAYALQTVLKRLGHEAILIDASSYLSHLFHIKKVMILLHRCFDKFILQKKVRLLHSRHLNKGMAIVCRNQKEFVDYYITPKIVVFSPRKLHRKSFDAIVVGSDQIWRPLYYPPIEDAYLSFARHWKIKRISYAASFGTDMWEYTLAQTRRCKSLIRRFDAVSVRETSGIRLCKDYLQVDAVEVLDPTMLLSTDDYLSLCKRANTPKSVGNLLVYILDKSADKQQLLMTICSDGGYYPFYVNSDPYNIDIDAEQRIQVPVEVWLQGFADAEFVVTDSFHACVFAILFNKPFVAYMNPERGGTRFESLLAKFNLQHRLLTTSDAFRLDELPPIDWADVNNRLHELRKHSVAYLRQSLA
ncbi:MAG: polysaccharide pyruvyl transferase family protein [Prevotellaceae bacterium]|jgi:hypothetical protein|nr:polysaccharide pyruvyl transferase family protein [Prevotellaceae bacterium]